MIRFSYRWTWRTIWPNISYAFYCIRRGIRNVWRWTPIIWWDEDFDWDNLAEIMEFKLRNMSLLFKNHGFVVDSDNIARELLVCAELLKRIREDDFASSPHPLLHESRMYGWQKELGRIIGRKLRTWWE